MLFSITDFWDGRVNNLSDQIDGPVHNVLEMDSNWDLITNYVSQSNHYTNLFKKYDLPITTHSIKSSLIEFMHGLTTPNSPFDQYLQGDSAALSDSALRGWETFQKRGCIRCHQGTNIGGVIMRFGYFGIAKTGSERSDDQGRYMFALFAPRQALVSCCELKKRRYHSPLLSRWTNGCIRRSH